MQILPTLKNNLFGTAPEQAPAPSKKRATSNFVLDEQEPAKPVWIPQVTINPNYLVLWDKWDGPRNYNTTGFSEQKYKGQLSSNSSKRVREVISWFTEVTKDKTHTTKEGQNIKYNLTFVTLTLPSKQSHDDQFIKRNLLNRFLVEIRRQYKVVNYFWKAEAQENGNIHFHVTLDKFIWYVDLRSLWNKILNDHGYIDAYQATQKEFFKDGFRLSENKYDKRSEQKQRDAYMRGRADNWRKPNTTDVHSVYKIKNVGGYLSKYCSKNLKVYKLYTKVKLWKVKQIFKKMEGFISIKQDEGFIKLKLNGITEETLHQYIEKVKLKIEKVVPVIIRDIVGRIWFCSRSLKQLKNYTTEMDNGIFSAVMELISRSKAREIIPMVKNKFTGILEPMKYVKVFVGKMLTTACPENIISRLSTCIDDHLKQFYETIKAELSDPVPI